jgi:hypothetical protein
MAGKNAKKHGGIGAHSAGVVKLALKYGYHQHTIAGYFGDNGGRVSEIKTGKRHPDVPMAANLPPDFPGLA